MIAAKSIHPRHKGATLLLSMIFVLVLSALAVSLATLSGANVQVASNQHKVNATLYAAQSGLECARYLVGSVTLPETSMNSVTDAQADAAWADLCLHVHDKALDGQTVSPSPASFTDAYGAGEELVTPAMTFGGSGAAFSLRFYRYASEPRKIKIQSTGASGGLTRRIGMEMDITKDREVLNYAIASRGRMWLTGDTTIHGDLFSAWDRASIAPYNMTSDSTVLGTINTVLTLDQIDAQSYDLETLDANDNPIDVNGVPLGTNYDDRYYGPYDEIQAYHHGINYGQPYQDMPGMDISDYNTDGYVDGLSEIPDTSDRATEYFPHAAGNYGAPSTSGSLRLTRYVYENQTFSNALLRCGRQALFRNCTFEGVLYVDCYKSSTSSTSYTNNV
ncbi:MAG: pilus assembly PilX N-terminal domain-containing protein, partial [Sedimentisphaerales bacterium]|nr:pilus assembly PilX N-terminal domain-containing protein [Sedimentisphaerales bacterium]